ncbi:MAG: hypothetical protein Q7W30_05055 [Coriobacteriia bacterium]|nr:hypothetical protein [Coriobacteriia bacterium]
MADAAMVALVRLAWRDVRADGYTTTVLAVLFALPVALATGGGVVARSAAATVQVASAANTPAADPRDLGFVYLMGMLALAEVCLAATAILGVKARRRLHSFGVLDVTGVTRRQRSTVALLGGMLPGAVGVAAGVVLGIAGGMIALPVLAYRRGLPAPHSVIAVVDGVIPMLVGLGAVFLASAGPALLVARTETCAALAGRRPAPAPDPRVLVVLGGLFASVGAVSVAVGALVPGINVVLVVLGTFIVAASFSLLVPSVVRGVAKHATDAPAPLRIALRDMARDWQRTLPTVVAVMACEALAVAVSAVLAAGEMRDAVSYGVIRGFVVAACAMVALSVVGLAAGTAGAEADAERSTADAVGLPRSFVRQTLALEAAAMALLGGIVAVPAGLIPALAVLLGRGTYDLVVPWDAIAIALFAAPAFAWTGCAFFARIGERAAPVRIP